MRAQHNGRGRDSRIVLGMIRADLAKARMLVLDKEELTEMDVYARASQKIIQALCLNAVEQKKVELV